MQDQDTSDAKRERQREAQRRYKEKHPERLRETERRYLEKHPEARARKRERNKERSRDYRKSQSGKTKREEYQHAYYLQPVVKDRERERNRRRKDEHREYGRRYHLLKTYGISGETWARMWTAQAGLCAICRSSEPVCVDHNHATGAIRQLLCQRCNQGLGFFDDDESRLRAAITYLRRHAVPPASKATQLAFC